jgi:hypothetical protein
LAPVDSFDPNGWHDHWAIFYLKELGKDCAKRGVHDFVFGAPTPDI